MVVLKIILAVWTSVYLVLPSCPCQILAALGIETSHVHSSQIAQGENSQIDTSRKFSSGIKDENPGPVCHCDDNEQKVAEQSDYDEDIQAGCKSSHLSVESTWLGVFQPEFVLLGRPPPPRFEVTSHLPRSVQGVYLL